MLDEAVPLSDSAAAAASAVDKEKEVTFSKLSLRELVEIVSHEVQTKGLFKLLFPLKRTVDQGVTLTSNLSKMPWRPTMPPRTNGSVSHFGFIVNFDFP